MHPGLRRKVTEHKRHLLEKQKLRYSYWVSETQFRNYVKKAFKKPGASGETLLSLLERRLDTIVFRMAFAPTLPSARQLVVHGHVLVNGRKVNRPFYSLAPGEKVSIREKSRRIPLIAEALSLSPARPVLPYVKVDRENLEGSLVSIPKREEIPMPINEALVIEYYAKYL
jgi:small subunit ribosomal protein S4